MTQRTQRPRKVYLGDSVYVVSDGSGLWLTTENGGPPSSSIYLEPEVYSALLAYVAELAAPCAHPSLDVNVCTRCGKVLFPIPGPGESAE
jgi:hypothetical protein